MDKLPFVSIIIPCRNEEKYIGICLDSILANDYSKDRLEILVVDGISEDGTRGIVEGYARRYGFIRFLNNPKKITPSALNTGIANAKGDIIMRMDAHNVYPPNYILGLVVWLEKTGADNVGGVWVTLPANNTPKAQAIACGLSHPFGVGNAYFRIGTSKPRWVNTVPFGCYKRELFDRVGMFDEELVRNQDGEFNQRIIKRGGRVLLVPEIFSYYYPRESFAKLWRMYYQYGYFRSIVAQKEGDVPTVRQVVPPLFVLSLLVTGTMATLYPVMGKLLGLIILTYAVADIACSAATVFKRGIKCALALTIVFLVLHLSYGLGYLMGSIRYFSFKRRRVNITDEMTITR
jgi:glycosyltransferase involved in cell wall biosynthesis